MTHRNKYRKGIAAFFLTLVVAQMILPVTASALTSGPAQPEASSFAQAGTSDMVDLFTGDFKYNLPVMDVDGYPLNLSYGSGSGMDDEASWTGLGWNINVGAVNRQLRGIPDDFSGSQFETEHFTKPKVTVGARVSVKAEFAGIPGGISPSGSLSMGVFSDNYTGIGAELGANAGISYTFGGSGLLTAGMGLGITSSTASGVDVSPSLSLSYRQKIADGTTVSPGLSASLGYNTRGGLKDLSLGASFSTAARNAKNNFNNSFTVGGATISFNTDPVNPKIQVPYKSFSGSFSFDLGPATFGMFLGKGGTGYVNVREVKSKNMVNPAYGFLYAERAKNRPDAMMDFLREKESAIIPEIPNLAVPVATPDLFSYTSQAGSGQFRLHRGGTGIFADNQAADESNTLSLGFDAGVGSLAHAGVTLYNQGVTNTTGRWNAQNQFKEVADFRSPTDNPRSEHAYFKQVGEKNVEDDNLAEQLGYTDPVAVKMNKQLAEGQWQGKTQQYPIASSGIAPVDRAKRRTAISYLTAEEAQLYGLEKTINYYSPIPYVENTPYYPTVCSPVKAGTMPRASGGLKESTNGQALNYRNKDHISEITVTDESGKRNVYGLPVYNAYQKEYSYAIGVANNGVYPNQNPNDVVRNLITQSDNGSTVVAHESPDNDYYLHAEKQPGYATSFLLTGILSPDYVDVTNNGITDDDLGTAIKFNYSVQQNLYQWRSPFGIQGANKATIVKGLLADPDDDKASFVHGAKELWYLHSIESKTKIAYFITEDREDGMGVSSWNATAPGGTKQKRLMEIRLFSKADPTTPIKVVKFKYGNLLCGEVPNNSQGTGKLTLTQVSFQYGKSEKGANHPYVFRYRNDPRDDDNSSVHYGFLQTDRWGTYKPTGANADNGFPQLRNDEYPYAVQSDEHADLWAGTWQLSQIGLPSGGSINVTYESDDYAYVQNKKAMRMTNAFQLVDKNNNATTSLRDARGMRLTGLDLAAVQTQEQFQNYYLNGSDYLYTKLYVNVGGYDAKREPSSERYYEFVPCYAKVKFQKVSSSECILKFEEIMVKKKDYPLESLITNPIEQAAWQRMRMEYPRFSYPGYRNRVRSGDIAKTVEAVVSALVNAARTLDELRRNFNERAYDLKFADQYMPGKSMIRLAEVDGFKNGGGSRVKSIMINDNWQSMSQDFDNLERVYGQEYDYTTVEDGKTISSGVASFEPSVGADENPLRLPVPYVQNIKGGLNTLFNLEEPFGESFYPGPAVGYSKVTVRDLNANGIPDPQMRTGYLVNEFYTAKEFPVITKALPINSHQRGPAGWYSFFGGSMVHEMTFAQGYSIELNDMHGKPKAVRVFNKAKSEISSSVYHYNTEPLNAGEMKLKNSVTVVNDWGEVEHNKILGREIEVFTDMRQQETSSVGETVQVGADIVLIAGFLFPWPHWPYKRNEDIKMFRSATTMKVIQYYALLDKVVKTENGSSIATENIAYDGITGEALVTKTTNEFEDPVYTVNFPAYWMHEGMGAAYKTIGTIMPAFETNADGTIKSGAYNGFLQAGDELVPLSAGPKRNHYWVIETKAPNASIATKKMVDADGKVVGAMTNETVKVIRSGYRNILMPPAASMVCMRNPISENPDPATGKHYLAFSKDEDLTAWKVLTASALRFDDTWGVEPVCKTCPQGYVWNDKEGVCEIPPIENTSDCFTICPGSTSSLYGRFGAAIYDPVTETSTDIPSPFWGGDCVPAGGHRGTSNEGAGHAENQVNALVQPTATLLDPCAGIKSPNNPGSDLCGRLNKTGIWLCAPDQQDPGDDEWMAFEFCVDIPEAKDYFLGFACDLKLNIQIDGTLFTPTLDNNYASNYEYWHVRKFKFSQAGKHTIRLTVVNPSTQNSPNAASVGFEIYNTTYAQLTTQGYAPAESDIIFSSARDLLNKNIQVYRFNTSTPRYTCPNNGTYSACDGCGKVGIDRVVNPYVNGHKGNWRPAETAVFQVNRSNSDLFNDKKKGVGVRNGGAFNYFRPFWTRTTSNEAREKWQPGTNVTQWVTSNTVTLYDKYGQELENKDALGRYSAAGFVFKGELPGAVASNARNREIVYESFEDARFKTFCGALVETNLLCNRPIFLRGNSANLSPGVSGRAHSGRYGFNLTGGNLVLTTVTHQKESKANPYSFINAIGEYTMTPKVGVFPIGFEPVAGEKYIISLWAKETMPLITTPAGVTVAINSANVTLKRKAHVEGWSMFEAEFDAPPIDPVKGDHGNFQLTIAPGAAIYIDDVRIHPAAAHMKTYAYDERNLRLMAELDENNFATFYEYDTEGGLVRVKKETERGIMTIKETRSSQRKFEQ